MKAWLTGLGVGTVFVVGAALGAGCGSSQSDLGLGNSSGSVGGGSATSTSNGAGGAGGATTSATGSTTGTGTTGVGGAGATTGSTTSTSSGGNACDPAAGDSACLTCSKMNCCAQYTACTADANCICWAACLDQNPGDLQGCFGKCGSPSKPTQDLGACANGSCQNECGSMGTTTSTGSGNPGVCDPSANDSTCTTCLKQSCCQQLSACEADQNCVCWVTCLQQNNNDFQMCFGQCGAPSSATQQLGNCEQGTCGNSCP